jgi:8-oxo-dGTP pyrophosphatase MutT (NUDIX family)
VWDLPGGHIEAGETELAALAREIHEELSVQVTTGSAIHLCRLEIGHGEESVRFSAWIVGEWEGTPANVAPEEHDEIRWFRPEELPPLIHEPVRTAVVEAMRSHKPSAAGAEGMPDVSKSVSGVARSRGENKSGPV